PHLIPRKDASRPARVPFVREHFRWWVDRLDTAEDEEIADQRADPKAGRLGVEQHADVNVIDQQRGADSTQSGADGTDGSSRSVQLSEHVLWTEQLHRTALSYLTCLVRETCQRKEDQVDPQRVRDRRG